MTKTHKRMSPTMPTPRFEPDPWTSADPSPACPVEDLQAHDDEDLAAIALALRTGQCLDAVQRAYALGKRHGVLGYTDRLALGHDQREVLRGAARRRGADLRVEKAARDRALRLELDAVRAADSQPQKRRAQAKAVLQRRGTKNPTDTEIRRVAAAIKRLG